MACPVTLNKYYAECENNMTEPLHNLMPLPQPGSLSLAETS